MTILAIMSIVLALCGATVTGIKESKAAMTDQVKVLLSVCAEAFKKIDDHAGLISQQACEIQHSRTDKKTVHDKASVQKSQFESAYKTYERMIWVPITVLIIISLMLAIRLMVIPASEFKNVITNPGETEILVAKWLLGAAFFINAIAFFWMFRCRSSMKTTADMLVHTATTFSAAIGSEIVHQVIAPANPPPNVA